VIKISWDQGFKRTYRKKVKKDAELKDRFWEATELFEKDPFNPRLRTHKLTGKLEGLWAFSVSFDCRVIFNFVSKAEVLLIDIGGHDEVY
jgi:proteic killer suppression protein